MEELLKEGTDPDTGAGKGDGKAPLYWAAMRGRVETARLLLDYGASVDLQDDFRSLTPLYLAAAHAPRDAAGVAMVELLLTRGADVNARNRDGHTPLHAAAWRLNTTLLELFLKRGAAVDARDNEGRTALMMTVLPFPATRRNAELLLEHGAALEARDNAGRTPLILAAARGELEWALFLLRTGSDATARDFEGRSATDHAAAPPPPHCSDSVFLELHRKAGKPERNDEIWERRERLAALLKSASAEQRGVR